MILWCYDMILPWVSAVQLKVFSDLCNKQTNIIICSIRFILQSVEVPWTLDKANWCYDFFYLQIVELFEKWSCDNKHEIKVSEWACIHAQYSVQTYLSRCHLWKSQASLKASLTEHWQSTASSRSDCKGLVESCRKHSHQWTACTLKAVDPSFYKHFIYKPRLLCACICSSRQSSPTKGSLQSRAVGDADLRSTGGIFGEVWFQIFSPWFLWSTGHSWMNGIKCFLGAHLLGLYHTKRVWFGCYSMNKIQQGCKVESLTSIMPSQPELRCWYSSVLCSWCCMRSLTVTLLVQNNYNNRRKAKLQLSFFSQMFFWLEIFTWKNLINF